MGVEVGVWRGLWWGLSGGIAEVVVGGCSRSFGGGLWEVIGNHLI